MDLKQQNSSPRMRITTNFAAHRGAIEKQQFEKMCRSKPQYACVPCKESCTLQKRGTPYLSCADDCETLRPIATTRQNSPHAPYEKIRENSFENPRGHMKPAMQSDVHRLRAVISVLCSPTSMKRLMKGGFCIFQENSERIHKQCTRTFRNIQDY